jgi:hypothetical protein
MMNSYPNVTHMDETQPKERISPIVTRSLNETRLFQQSIMIRTGITGRDEHILSDPNGKGKTKIRPHNPDITMSDRKDNG